MRFNHPAYPSVYFCKQILVKCPICSGPASIINDARIHIIPFPGAHKAKCNCSNCGFKKEGKDKWHGYMQGFIDRSCGFCGTKICFTSKPTKEPFTSSSVQCDTCKKEKEYTLCWYRYSEEKPTDPYFGLELWLQTTIKSKTLWLYNLEHLNYLRAYVAAKLREDDGRHKYSMITNLPQWIKSAKHRDLIVKKLDRLEQELMKQGIMRSKI